jgi:hypothetical protein
MANVTIFAIIGTLKIKKSRTCALDKEIMKKKSFRMIIVYRAEPKVFLK